jgi:hypothetical protein
MLALQSTKILDGYQMVVQEMSFPKGVPRVLGECSPVNRPYGVWCPKEKIKNNFCYAFVTVVSLVVTVFDI